LYDEIYHVERTENLRKYFAVVFFRVRMEESIDIQSGIIVSVETIDRDRGLVNEAFQSTYVRMTFLPGSENPETGDSNM
jgi:hypothetical protein